jgi:hypothetical protein
LPRLSASPTEDGRLDGSEAGSGSTIETIWLAEKVETVLETLQETAGPEGLPVPPSIQAWLAHPLSEQDVRCFGGPSRSCGTAHAVLRPIAQIADVSSGLAPPRLTVSGSLAHFAG